MTEDVLISRLRPLLPVSRRAFVASGDDSAVYSLSGAATLSVDMLVEGVHFRPEWSNGADVGARSAAQNLADAVAMGARPTSLVVGLAVPPTTEGEWVEDFARGMASVCEPLGVGVDGGDFVASDQIVVSVTVLGQMEGREPLRRSGMQMEDKLVFAGNLGHGRAGYELLNAGYTREDKNPKIAAMIEHFLVPQPPLEIALAAASTGQLRSLMDVSDGLVKDVGRMAGASGVWVDIDHHAITRLIGPIATAAGRLSADRSQWAYTGGEDHGFVGTVAKDAPIPGGFTRIGTVRGAALGGRVTVGGVPFEGNGGWDHFAQ
ncbi:thiamine-monophosphate kinase [Arcanobacterium wilhelmae]|uniref:Thiamine-monophosphate kinase n=1 Tax=Arcanobacterium wilhelmae TaxID=1803177 RepID=A0ABT9NE09_9ACTO|nr:thiamine-phosphate kinase [Arcanobacterium wilhelmae]MDP9801616.1 thiamine-monophosphate kinase [Arcanobacterium wilhelmae]WFN90939.1 thiamine-phosphate kinase [Arcanobacterium wilhelmae]